MSLLHVLNHEIWVGSTFCARQFQGCQWATVFSIKLLFSFACLEQETINEECIFRETLTRNFYDKYCSYKHSQKDLALGVMKTGAAVIASKMAGSYKEYENQFITKKIF